MNKIRENILVDFKKGPKKGGLLSNFSPFKSTKLFIFDNLDYLLSERTSKDCPKLMVGSVKYTNLIIICWC